MQPVGYKQTAMTQRTEPSPPEARYIAVQDVAYALATGCTRTFRKHLLTTERLQIQQTLIKGGGDPESYGACDSDRVAYAGKIPRITEKSVPS